LPPAIELRPCRALGGKCDAQIALFRIALRPEFQRIMGSHNAVNAQIGSAPDFFCNQFNPVIACCGVSSYIIVRRMKNSSFHQSRILLPRTHDKHAGDGCQMEASVYRFRTYIYILAMAGLLACLTASMTGQSKPKGEIDLVGYAHTDLSWLWPHSETIHEVLP